MKKYSFRKWIRNWLAKPYHSEPEMPSSIVSARDLSDLSENNPIRLHIYPANGGFVIETKTYDRVKDRVNSNLYIVNDGADLSEELGKIVTMSALSR